MKSILKNSLVLLTQKLDRLIYGKKDFVVISNNCWGAELYKRLGLQYNTPFVGLFIYGPDYIKLLENFDFYLDSDLSFTEKSKWDDSTLSYPIGLLEDIEVHFVHYKDKEEALAKWKRRSDRMKAVTDKDQYYFKICDRDLTDAALISKFHQLPFKNKISFGIRPVDHKNHFHIKENEQNLTVPAGPKLYRYSYKYIDLLKWVTSGEIDRNLYSKIKSAANIAIS